jgi:hypothetical protein
VSVGGVFPAGSNRHRRATFGPARGKPTLFERRSLRPSAIGGRLAPLRLRQRISVDTHWLSCGREGPRGDVGRPFHGPSTSRAPTGPAGGTTEAFELDETLAFAPSAVTRYIGYVSPPSPLEAGPPIDLWLVDIVPGEVPSRFLPVRGPLGPYPASVRGLRVPPSPPSRVSPATRSG